ncbi:MAG: nitrilase-related carbon-nitrogen hydrolase [Candidatus Aminicenantes bacterium]|jgi:predicted amidohydrolase
MKVALAQISPHLGNLRKNLDLHFQSIEKAKKKKADLLIFPELSLTGYTLMDMVDEVSLTPGKNPIFKELKAASREISLVVGFVEEMEKGLFYNSAAFLSKGKILHIHRKVFLPTFGMFDEARFYAQGKNFHIFPSPFGKTGMMICRDFLSYGASYLLFAGGAEIIIVISAAPGRGTAKEEAYETSRMWEIMGETISRFSTVFLIYCNRVGFEDGKHFAGGSFIYNPAGEMVARAAYVDQDFLFSEINLDEVRESRKKWPYKRDDKPEIILEALKRIVRKYED